MRSQIRSETQGSNQNITPAGQFNSNSAANLAGIGALLNLVPLGEFRASLYARSHPSARDIAPRGSAAQFANSKTGGAVASQPSHSAMHSKKTNRRGRWASKAVEDGELFFKQVVKCLAGIVWPDRGKTSRRRCRRNRYGRRRSIFLDGRSECVERAVVSSILFGNALKYRAGAFELRSRIEIGALLAAMKVEAAARASSLWVKPRLQHSPAIRTTRARDCSHHPGSPRSDLLLMWTMLWWAFLFLFRGISIHVAPVAILPLQ